MNHCDEADSRGLSQHFDEAPVRKRLAKVPRSSTGGARISEAVLSRTGVLEYRTADGSTRRELRLPEEVAKSLDSLRGAPVVVGHPYEIGGLLDATSWRDHATGHAEHAKLEPEKNNRGEQLVTGSLLVQHAPTLDSIERGELDGISLGYTSRLDWQSGVYHGQPYDCIQRDITNNHVALLKPGGGRVNVASLRLDSKGKNMSATQARFDAIDRNLSDRVIDVAVAARRDDAAGVQSGLAAMRAELDECSRLERSRRTAELCGLKLDDNGEVIQQETQLDANGDPVVELDDASNAVVEARVAHVRRLHGLNDASKGARAANTSHSDAGDESLDDASNAVVDARLRQARAQRGL